ncbi:hypothetical protein AGABI2DRAFT_120486 [Agaricus bisporus var. bisporus H97]|uniref:hypothetical protein n=1 Tax=Agaricus bisporus var. bisporus (strain H97 / ATCC MYA-4626 / FGSC 10389) TaxID=936046 RepID=UPI00029F800C|nr:hypothetical protein AGABI2DRAFT_120486 [Agaricus bisporus var. bisporus H97]EKV44355.1 hypothetical protein AGABI2DRAFT_120486 [Agaricus bisporus var. bisporus H97]
MDQAAALETAIRTSRYISFASVAGTTIMVLDWLLNIHHEIRLIWRANWSITKVLYLSARYIPFIDFPLMLRYQFGSLNADQCRTIYNLSATLFVVSVIFAELIFTIRTWAAWSNGKYVAVGLFGTFALSWATIVVLAGLYLKGTHHQAPHLPPLIGCILLSAGSYLKVLFIIIAFFDTLMLGLMAIQAVSVFRDGGDSHLLRTVYGDGISFYIYLVVLSIINLIVISRFTDFVTLLVMLQGTIHSVLACRVVLHIRHLSHVPTSGAENTEGDWTYESNLPHGHDILSTPTRMLSPKSGEADEDEDGDSDGSDDGVRFSEVDRSRPMVMEIS